jgi:hypothetical protein
MKWTGSTGRPGRQRGETNDSESFSPLLPHCPPYEAGAIAQSETHPIRHRLRSGDWIREVLSNDRF